MIAQILTNNWYVPWVSFKTLKINFKSYLVRIIIPLLIIFIGSSLVNFLIRYLFNIKGFFLLAFAFIPGFLIGAVLMVLFFDGFSTIMVWFKNRKKRLSKV
ncbi:hypothetical protein D3C81_1982310 [compost metagenome]